MTGVEVLHTATANNANRFESGMGQSAAGQRVWRTLVSESRPML